jgi:Rrf2 family protein
MKMSHGVEWALHCVVALSQADAPIPSSRLAQFHGVSPTYLAKHLQALSRAGIVGATQGQAGGYELTRAPGRVTVLDVVQAIEGEERAFRCNEIRWRSPLRMPERDCSRPCGIAAVMWAAEKAWRESLASVSIADLAGGIDARRVGDWLRSSVHWAPD